MFHSSNANQCTSHKAMAAYAFLSKINGNALLANCTDFNVEAMRDCERHSNAGISNVQTREIATWDAMSQMRLVCVEITYTTGMDSYKETLAVMVHNTPTNFIKLYPTLSDVELPIINRICGTDYAIVGNRHHSGRTAGRTLSNYPIEKTDVSNIWHTVTFIDGSAYGAICGDNMPERQGYGFTSPQSNYSSMFGDRKTQPAPVNPQPVFAQPAPSGESKDIAELKKKVRDLENSVSKLTPLHKWGVTFEPFYGELSEDEGIHYPTRNGTHTLRIVDDCVYVVGVHGTHKAKECDSVKAVNHFMLDLLGTSDGADIVEQMGFFIQDGVTFKKLGFNVRSPLGWKDLYEWSDGPAYENVAITKTDVGLGYVLVRGRDGAITTYEFHRTVDSAFNPTLGDCIHEARDLPQMTAYAYNSSVRKTYSPAELENFCRAVRATIVQVGKETLTYRREIQMAIDVNFTLERVMNFPIYDFLESDLETGQLYRFKKSGSDIVVYATYKDEGKPEVLNLSNIETAKLNRLDGTVEEHTALHRHCEKLVNTYTHVGK